MGGGISAASDTKTVVVLGGAYGGARAAQVIANGLPEGWRLLLVDRNSHANHVYVMPRYAVLPGHEYKSFIPYTKVFLVDPPKPAHIFLQATVHSLRPNHITISKTFPEYGINETTIAFDYAVYALGSHLPPPLDLWGSSASVSGKANAGNVAYHGLKSEGCQWFKEKQVEIKAAPTILVVGGGALGIQFATDIKSVYPGKQVTLLHSRKQLLPRFDQKMHDEILKTCEEIRIDVILGERLDLDSIEGGKAKANNMGKKIVRTVTGREISADLLLLCTGQSVNTAFLKTMDPSTVNDDNNLARVLKTMQLHNSEVVDEQPTEADISAQLEHTSIGSESTKGVPGAAYPHIFVVGDAADAFGAIAAGHNAYAQAEVAARNVIRLIKRQESGDADQKDIEALELYHPHPPAIKVSLGLTKAVAQVGPNVIVKNDGQEDLQAAAIWPFFGLKVEKDEDMYA